MGKLSNLCTWYGVFYLVGRKGIVECYLGPVFCTVPCLGIPATDRYDKFVMCMQRT